MNNRRNLTDLLDIQTGPAGGEHNPPRAANLSLHGRDGLSGIESLLDAMPGILCLLDSERKLVWWNRKLESFSEYPPEELSGMDWLVFFRGRDAERIAAGLAEAGRTGFAGVEADVYTRSGRSQVHSFDFVPLDNENGSLFMGVGLNVAFRREMEEEQRVYRDRLEALVLERTADLSAANQELAAMNHELQSANCLLEQEVKRRRENERQLLRRERQYRAATHLLTRPAEEAAERFSLILHDALDLIGAPAGYIGVLDAERKVVLRRYCVGPIDFDSMAPQSIETGMMAEVFRQGNTVHLADYRDYPARIGDSRLARITTILMVPMKQGLHVKGILAAHWLDNVHPVGREGLEVLQQYSDLATAFLERMETHADIRHLAYHDVLTGMANRASLNLWLEEELSKARRGETRGILFFIDLDELKVVNDTFGHSVGDDMILTAGNHIRETFGKDAFCARIGGDEFIVALTGEYGPQSVRELADRVLQTLGRDYVIFNERVPMSASVGVVIFPEHGGTANEVLKNADIAMYAAKAGGRNCWKIYEPSLQKDAYEVMMLTNSLRRAEERDELALHFQPKIRLADRSIEGFEALLRWESAEHGPVSPARFIPLAEKSGVIIPIGGWVLREACLFARRLADRGRPDIHVAVNISARQLAAVNFTAKVREVLAETGIEAAQLQMEVTESILIESMEDSVRNLEHLRALGIRIALDDFGTGYSSLTYLRRLPVSTLKVDKSFIDGILADAKQAEFVGFIIELAHALNLQVVAEGVEQEAQLDKLSQYACDCIQGFVFSRPVPADAAVGLLDA